tara:strand:- start:48 stop:284 length:237 start_codon:yes stop_codon:yes gene_type:complete
MLGTLLYISLDISTNILLWISKKIYYGGKYTGEFVYDRYLNYEVVDLDDITDERFVKKEISNEEILKMLENINDKLEL